MNQSAMEAHPRLPVSVAGAALVWGTASTKHHCFFVRVFLEWPISVADVFFMRKHRLQILAIQETRAREEGRVELPHGYIAHLEGGMVVQARRNNATLVWKFTTGGKVDSSLVVVNHVLYVGSDDNSLEMASAPGLTGLKITQSKLFQMKCLP